MNICRYLTVGGLVDINYFLFDVAQGSEKEYNGIE